VITTNLYDASDAKKIVYQKGPFSILEYVRDLSVRPEQAQSVYFATQMGVRKRQLIAQISRGSGIVTQRGTMQLMLGDLDAVTDISGVGSFVRKFVGSKVTGETAVKPHYTGDGTLVLEPTFRHIILEDLDEWNGEFVVEDGMFLACQDSVELSVTTRTNVSSAVLGGEGLFNTTFRGHGFIALESPVPRSELIDVVLDRDVIKIDGSMALAWSRDLQFTVERTTPTLIGSMAAGEGLVNVYRGSGRILIAPVQYNFGIPNPNNNAKGI
jgi:uncharacterized protein (AIM24 family)